MAHRPEPRRSTGVRVLSSLAAAALALAACSSTKEYCEERCKCQGGCSDEVFDACIDDLNDDYTDAVSDGCRADADDYLGCLATEPECRAGGVFDASRCDDEAARLARCRLIGTSSSGSANGGAGGIDITGGVGGTGNVVGSGGAGGG